MMCTYSTSCTLGYVFILFSIWWPRESSWHHRSPSEGFPSITFSVGKSTRPIYVNSAMQDSLLWNLLYVLLRRPLRGCMGYPHLYSTNYKRLVGWLSIIPSPRPVCQRNFSLQFQNIEVELNYEVRKRWYYSFSFFGSRYL